MTRGTRSRTRALLGALVLGVALAATTAAAPAAPELAAGKLDLEVWLRQSGPFHIPPTGDRASVPFRTSELIRGLGRVSVNSTWLLGLGPPACAAGFAKPLTTISQLNVAGKGTISITFAEAARCAPFEEGSGWWQHEPQEFTITAGTGRFAAASGRGTREHLLFGVGGPTEETWTGTLEVPGLEFDLIAPVLHGAKSVRAQTGARSARVTFRVTATDRVDGAVPVSCQPRSGARFTIGRTIVRCGATDSSGNTATAAFAVTVSRRR